MNRRGVFYDGPHIPGSRLAYFKPGEGTLSIVMFPNIYVYMYLMI